MKNINHFLAVILVLTTVVTACDTEDDLVRQRIDDNPLIPEQPITGTPGNADFTRYVAIGNSITAGYMDGALYNDGQANAFPNLLATQFQISGVDGGEFNQPDINSVLGYNTIAQNPDPFSGAILGRFQLDLSIPGPVPTFASPADSNALFSRYSGPPVNNFGVPGILLGQLLTPATGGPNPDPNPDANPAYNPYYFRFASEPSQDGMSGSTILDDAIAAKPTFFTMWIGNNDVLGYALSGATDEDIFTSAGEFDFQYNTALEKLLSDTTANGVIVNIPPILALPVFRAVPYNPVPLDEDRANALNDAFQGLNNALDGLVAISEIEPAEAAKRKVTYAAGNNPLLIFDQDLEDLSEEFDALLLGSAISPEQRAALQPYVQSRPATPDDLVILTALPEVGRDLDPSSPGTLLQGITVPFGNQYILTLEEQSVINDRYRAFNNTIETAAVTNSDRVALYDTNAPDGLFMDIFGASDGVPGAVIDGFNYQPDFSPNGVFSTDAVHPNPKGQAIIANEIIAVINASFNADIPRIDIVPSRTVIVSQ